MKHIISITISSLLLALTSCSKEETIILDSVSEGTVHFTVSNLTVGGQDFAKSIRDDSYDYSENTERDDSFSFNYLTKYNDTWDVPHTFSQTLDNTYTLWTGGYNEILITLEPSSPDEVATFTLPDGTTFELTASNNSFLWIIDQEAGNRISDRHNGYYWRDERVIEAKSTYKSGQVTYRNTGMVNLLFDSYSTRLQYNAANGQWYENKWLNDPILQGRANVDFTVTNLTVGEIDTANSIIGFRSYYGRYGESRSTSFDIPYYSSSSSSSPSNRNILLSYSNEFWIGRNNQVKFTFHPSCPEEKEVILYLPDGTTQTLTAENPDYTWATSSDYYTFSGYNNYITMTSHYERDGMRYEAEGYVYMQYGSYYSYDSTDGKWYYGR